jgi:two-component system nitrogen regulation response regulator NtrX
MNILIIDDDKDYLADVLMMLGDEYNCFTATSAKKGLRIFRNEIIDLVLLDIYIGNEYEGLELLETFKKLDGLVPIIMITNYDDVSTVGDTDEADIVVQHGHRRNVVNGASLADS